MGFLFAEVDADAHQMCGRQLIIVSALDVADTPAKTYAVGGEHRLLGRGNRSPRARIKHPRSVQFDFLVVLSLDFVADGNIEIVTAVVGEGEFVAVVDAAATVKLAV